MLIKVFPKVGILINVVGQKLFSLNQHRLAYSSMRGGWKMLEPVGLYTYNTVMCILMDQPLHNHFTFRWDTHKYVTQIKMSPRSC